MEVFNHKLGDLRSHVAAFCDWQWQTVGSLVASCPPIRAQYNQYEANSHGFGPVHFKVTAVLSAPDCDCSSVLVSCSSRWQHHRRGLPSLLSMIWSRTLQL